MSLLETAPDFLRPSHTGNLFAMAVASSTGAHLLGGGELDEDVLQRRAEGVERHRLQPVLVHERVDGAEHARRVGSHQVVLVPEGAHLADAGQPRQSAFLVVLKLAVKRYLDRLRFGGRLLQPFGSVDSDELRAVYDGDPLA